MTATTVTRHVPVERCVYCHETKADAKTCTDGSPFHVFHEADERVEFASAA